jgi:hypothetical protein
MSNQVIGLGGTGDGLDFRTIREVIRSKLLERYGDISPASVAKLARAAGVTYTTLARFLLYGDSRSTRVLHRRTLAAVGDVLAVEPILYRPQYVLEFVQSASLWLPNIEEEMLEYFARHPKDMLRMPSRKFEELVAAIFKNNGFEVELTPAIKDGGLDLIAIRNDGLTGKLFHIIECKRWSHEHRVGVGVVRQLQGVMGSTGATKGILVTTSFFTAGARAIEQQHETHLSLSDYDAVVTWLRQLARRLHT